MTSFCLGYHFKTERDIITKGYLVLSMDEKGLSIQGEDKVRMES